MRVGVGLLVTLPTGVTVTVVFRIKAEKGSGGGWWEEYEDCIVNTSILPVN